MRILHISDLHFGHHNPQLLESLKTRATILKPDLILATGDLAHHCDEVSLTAARNYLQELAKLCSQSPEAANQQLPSQSPDGANQQLSSQAPEAANRQLSSQSPDGANVPKLLVIPGNHDCSLGGWIPISATQRQYREVFGTFPSSHFFPLSKYGFTDLIQPPKGGGLGRTVKF